MCAIRCPLRSAVQYMFGFGVLHDSLETEFDHIQVETSFVRCIVFIGRLHFLNFERMNKLIDGAYGHPCQMHKRTWND